MEKKEKQERAVRRSEGERVCFKSKGEEPADLSRLDFGPPSFGVSVRLFWPNTSVQTKISV